MTNKAIRVFVLALGLTATLATSSLFAQQGVYQKVNIPFAFFVERTALPAGDYRIEPIFGKEIVSLVNLTTGQRVNILPSEGVRLSGKAKLVFEVGPRGYSLKKMS